MGFFKKIGKFIEKNIPIKKVVKEGGRLLKKGEKILSNIIPHTHSAERRATMAAAKEQIDFYHAQKEELARARQETETEKAAERSRISEKQIRARQHTYRRGGFMAPTVSEIKNTLG